MNSDMMRAETKGGKEGRIRREKKNKDEGVVRNVRKTGKNGQEIMELEIKASEK